MKRKHYDNPTTSSASCDYDDEDDDDSESETVLKTLTKKRRKDVIDGFKEEKAESERTKRRLNLSESEERLTDSDESTTQEAKECSLSPASGEGTMETGQYSHEMMEFFKRQGLDKNVGLGKRNTGIKQPIQLPSQKGRAGFGSKGNEFTHHAFNLDWDWSQETKQVEEHPVWISASDEARKEAVRFLKGDTIKLLNILPKPKETIDDEDHYCNAELLGKMLSAKSVFDYLSDRELMEARARANPYETIKSGFFQNRAAMKAANLDAVFEWIFTREDKKNLLQKNPIELCEDGTMKRGINTDRREPLFYFADVCAGPGGFSEYVLWRKGFYNAKGFGFTLKGKDDFKLERFTAASPVYFEPFYGTYLDGDVTRPKNIESFEKLVKEATVDGVHLMMADGGFSVGEEQNIQEIRSKRLYLCQFLVALSIVRAGGVFFCKLFDIFTPFSIGLIYLMYIAFDQISLHKPNTSRPANSERYIVCKGLRPTEASLVKDFFTKVNNRLNNYKTENSKEDVYEVFPQDVIFEDMDFVNYIKTHNDSFLKNQILYLEKYRVFAKDHGKVDLDQGKLKDDCMGYWSLPKIERKNKGKSAQRRMAMMDSLTRLCNGELIEFNGLRKPRPSFLLKHALNLCDKGMKYEELRFCVLGGRDDLCFPKIVFSDDIGDVYIQSDNGSDGFTKSHQPPRIPRNTLLLVQETESVRKLEERNVLQQKNYVFRILDAAVIDSDDVSRLPFDERINAAKKMCSAVRLYGPNKGSCNIFAAEVLKLDDLEERKRSFKKFNYKNEESIFYKENNQLKFRCRGMWVVNLLKDPWHLVWSKTNRNCYLYNSKTGQTQLCAETKDGAATFKNCKELDCFSTFWDAISCGKDEEKICVRQWNWLPARDDNSEYGPTTILEKEMHSSGKPTFQSLLKVSEEQKAKCELCSTRRILWSVAD